MAGQLNLIRGRYEFFDTLLTLDSGAIDFNDGAVDNPALDIKGRLRGKQITAVLAVSGRAAAPEISLTSDPSLPQDEILARVFFNKDVSQLTPMELVRIAQIVAFMSGHGGSGGNDPISQLRKKAGIDMLSVNQDQATGAASVTVGKYLSDGIFIAVDQGAGAGSSAVKLEVEVTPNIQVETRIGNSNDNSVGVNWKKDY